MTRQSSSSAVASQPLDDELLASFIEVSRSLVAVAARSLAAVEHVVTLPQYRVLLLVSTRPSIGVKELASDLRVQPSTVTRMCDRLVAKGLVERRTSERDRREVDLRPTPAGRALLSTVTRRRRAEITRALRRLDLDDRRSAAAALDALAAAVTGDHADAGRLGWP